MNLTSFFYIPHPSLVLAQKWGPGQGLLAGKTAWCLQGPGRGVRVQSPPWVAVEPLLGPATTAELSFSPECWSLSKAGICAGKTPRAWHYGAVQLHFSPGLHPLLKPIPSPHIQSRNNSLSLFCQEFCVIWGGGGGVGGQCSQNWTPPPAHRSCCPTQRRTRGHLESFSLYQPLNAEKAMAPHSSTLAWRIPWMEEPGGLQSMGSLGVGHD
ncbi:hypothetical protein R6Z07F_010647 [Ovis aries]